MAKAEPSKSRKRGRARTSTGKPRQPKAEPLPWLCIVDELNDIRALLRIVPDLTAAIKFITDQRSGVEDKRDRLSRWADQALGIDLDSPQSDDAGRTERFPDLEEVVLAPEAMRDEARWRLWRLSRLIHEAIRADLLGAPRGRQRLTAQGGM